MQAVMPTSCGMSEVWSTQAGTGLVSRMTVRKIIGTQDACQCEYLQVAKQVRVSVEVEVPGVDCVMMSAGTSVQVDPLQG